MRVIIKFSSLELFNVALLTITFNHVRRVVATPITLDLRGALLEEVFRVAVEFFLDTAAALFLTKSEKQKINST